MNSNNAISINSCYLKYWSVKRGYVITRRTILWFYNSMTVNLEENEEMFSSITLV